MEASTAWVAVAVGLFPGLVVSRVAVRDGGDPRIWVVLVLIVTTLVALAVPIVFAGLRYRPSASDFGCAGRHWSAPRGLASPCLSRPTR